MDFFEHQDRARRGTSKLVVLFVLAVVCVCGAVYAAAAGVYVVLENGQRAAQEARGLAETSGTGAGFWNPELFVIAVGGTLLVIGAGTAHKVLQLSGGGAVVARMLGGRPVPLDAVGENQRRLMNVVEEMAIASGVPMPEVFELPEDGINAFAAGTAIETSVIGVTRGAVQKLSRDELQGVIAHEFSHILNGDCRINMRLMGVLHGILAIGIGGVLLMRSVYYAGLLGGGNRRSSNNNGGGAVLVAMIVFGAMLAAIGYIGTFFGNLIKAAVSREREYLADAAAVQFTRSPDGISGALKKIGGAHSKGRLRNPRAGEASHMYFAQGVSISMASLLSTHPPLRDRIKRLDPGWDGKFLAPTRVERDPPLPGPGRIRRRVSVGGEEVYGEEVDGPRTGPGRLGLGGLDGILGAAAVADALQGSGRPVPEAINRAAEILEQIPPSLRSAAEEPFGARAVVFALLLDRQDRAVRDKQLSRLRSASDEAMAERTDALAVRAGELPGPCRLPLMDMAIGALRALSDSQYQQFRQNVGVLIAADDKLDAFEWVVQRIVVRTLDRHFGIGREPRVVYHNAAAVRRPLSDLVSIVVHIGHPEDAEARQAFQAAARTLGGVMLSLRPRGAVGLAQLNAAVEAMERSDWRVRGQALNAVLAAVQRDGRVTVREAELLRGLAGAMGVPSPPIVATE